MYTRRACSNSVKTLIYSYTPNGEHAEFVVFFQLEERTISKTIPKTVFGILYGRRTLDALLRTVNVLKNDRIVFKRAIVDELKVEIIKLQNRNRLTALSRVLSANYTGLAMKNNRQNYQNKSFFLLQRYIYIHTL